jgi:site-specific recombinase XerD
VVLGREEVRAVLAELEGAPRLMAMLLYGAGLRLLECARLRVEDVDFATSIIMVRDGKGGKDRWTMLPGSVREQLAKHLMRVRTQHERDLAHGAGWVELPHAIGRKYPNAGREWAWQWVFPATRVYVDSAGGRRRWHHLHESVLQRAVRDAVCRAGMAKPASRHTIRRTLATHLAEDGDEIGAVQEPLGQKGASATVLHTRVLTESGAGFGARWRGRWAPETRAGRSLPWPTGEICWQPAAAYRRAPGAVRDGTV